MENNNLFSLIQERLDPDEIIDLLGLGTGHLCLLLRKQIIEQRHKFEEFLEIYDYTDTEEED